MLVSRLPLTVDASLPSIAKPWRQRLLNHEQHFLADNQLSVSVDPKNPGCERIHFYPLPFPHAFEGAWNFEALVNHDSLRSIGPRLDLVADETELTFQPHQIVKQMRIGLATLHERSAVSGNTLVTQWESLGLEHITLQFGLPYFVAQTEPIAIEDANGLVIQIHEAVYVAVLIRGAQRVVFRVDNVSDTTNTTHAFACSAEITLDPDASASFNLSLTCGYSRESVLAEAGQAALQPDTIFAAAEHTWDDYFSRAVPFFACSDTWLEQLYYYQAYLTRANLYDIPYEPFTHPYTCPWKTGAVWQWSWNTPMNSVCERWLNDKRIGAGGILLEAANGGGLNIGSYLHPLRKMTEMRGHDEAMRQVGEFRKSMPAGIDLATYTTIPHTTPNGLLGAWEFYLSVGDPIFLRQMLQLMLEAEQEFSKHELPSGLYTCSFVDEFDYSLRLKPFIAGFRKGDPEMMLKMDTPFVAVDYNCYLYALRERILDAQALLSADGGEVAFDVNTMSARNARLKAAIQQWLWDPNTGFYYDLDPRTMQRSNVKCIAAFSALYAGIADRSQANKLVEHLTNPREFGTPYPCPSISMDTPEVDPTLITYGGDCMITSGIWFTVEGLMRYGFKALAASYINKTIEMMTTDGPSSSYSYHALTGKPNQPQHTLAAQSAIVTDLICKYVVGLVPRHGRTFELAPMLDSLDELTFGPYQYCGRWVTVKWARSSGYEVHIDGKLHVS